MPEINLRKNILLSGSFRIVVLGLAFVASWISARYLGVELKGKFSYLTTLCGFIWIVLDLGLYRSYPYLIRKFPAKVKSLFAWTLFTFILETAVLLFLGLGLMGFWNSVLSFSFNPLYIALVVGYITLTKAFMQLQSLYVGLDRVLTSSLAHFSNALICVLIFAIGYLFFRSGDRLAYVLATTLIGLAGSLVLLSVQHKWNGWWKTVDPRFIRSAYGFGSRVFLSSLFILLLVRSDIIIVKKMLGFADVGIYSIGAQIVDMLQVASNLVGGLLLVKLSDTDDDAVKWLVMKKLLMVFGVFLTIANLGFVLLGKVILATMFGSQFVPAYYVYLWLIPASYGLSFGSLFNQYLNSKGFPIISIILPAIALALNIGLNLLFIPIWGINGAAISTSIAYLLWFIMIIAIEQRRTRGRMLKHLIPVREDWIELWNVGLQTVQNASKRVRR